MVRRRDQQETDPIDSYTTAQQLGAFRRDLLAQGFTEEEAGAMVQTAFRCEVGFVVRIADIRGEPLPMPQDDEQSA